MKVRVLDQKTDWAEWRRLRQALWPDCKGARAELEMRGFVRDRKKFGVLVIERDDGKLGGFAEVALRDGVDEAVRDVTAFLEGWYVDADLRARGWGRRLVRAAERWAAERGMVELASDAELHNLAGIAAHRAVGFRETFRSVQFLKKIRR